MTTPKVPVSTSASTVCKMDKVVGKWSIKKVKDEPDMLLNEITMNLALELKTKLDDPDVSDFVIKLVTNQHHPSYEAGRRAGIEKAIKALENRTQHWADEHDWMYAAGQCIEELQQLIKQDGLIE